MYIHIHVTHMYKNTCMYMCICIYIYYPSPPPHISIVCRVSQKQQQMQEVLLAKKKLRYTTGFAETAFSKSRPDRKVTKSETEWPLKTAKCVFITFIGTGQHVYTCLYDHNCCIGTVQPGVQKCCTVPIQQIIQECCTVPIKATEPICWLPPMLEAPGDDKTSVYWLYWDRTEFLHISCTKTLVSL